MLLLAFINLTMAMVVGTVTAHQSGAWKQVGMGLAAINIIAFILWCYVWFVS